MTETVNGSDGTINGRAYNYQHSPCLAYDLCGSPRKSERCSLEAYHNCSGLSEPSIAEAAQTVGAPGVVQAHLHIVHTSYEGGATQTLEIGLTPKPHFPTGNVKTLFNVHRCSG